MGSLWEKSRRFLLYCPRYIGADPVNRTGNEPLNLFTIDV